MIEKIVNESLKETYEIRTKKEEENKTEKEIKRENKNKMEIEWNTFRQENYKRKDEEKKKECKLLKYITGEIAKIIKGKHKLLTACKKIKRTWNKKKEQTERSKN